MSIPERGTSRTRSVCRSALVALKQMLKIAIKQTKNSIFCTFACPAEQLNCPTVALSAACDVMVVEIVEDNASRMLAFSSVSQSCKDHHDGQG